MFFKKIYYFLIGYLNITVEGYFIERFINLCLAKNIFLWNGKRKKSSILNCNIGIREFKKIKEIAKSTKCRIHINKKRGIPILFKSYKKRKLFFIMFILLIAVLITLSNFIWNIEINGTETIENEKLVEELANLRLESWQL